MTSCDCNISFSIYMYGNNFLHFWVSAYLIWLVSVEYG